MEYLRTIAHLRPRANTFNAVFRVRSLIAYAIHKFFQEKGFVYVHAPIITTSDAEGAGEMFQVTTLDIDKIAKSEPTEVDYSKDFFNKKTHLTVSGQLEAEAFAEAFKNIYTFGPTFRAELSNTPRHAAEFWMLEPEMAFEVEGVNDRVQLAALERQFQAFQAKQLMQQGVHLIDPSRFDLRGNLTVGQDVRIDINVIIEGDCELGNNVEIGAGCIIKNTKIAAGTKVQPYSIFDSAIVGEDTQIGPFARLRPGAKLANEVHIGNFVEVKNTTIGLGSKANHFTYLGDAEVGAGSNIGAGTITCNYDGANKFKTIIGDQAFIGSNSSLVAPVRIGNGATVGAGSTITRDVEDNSLAVERSKQFAKENYPRPQKIKK